MEERAIATVYVATGRDLAGLVKPPRTLFVNYPMGNNFGPAKDADAQREILQAALAMVHTATAGQLLDYPVPWGRAYQYAPGGKVIGTTG